MIRSFPHFGIHVADIESSKRFYIEGLGFEPQEGGRSDALGSLLELPRAVVRTQFIRHPDGMRMELWTVEGCAPDTVVDPRPANVRGRPHLCFLVDDLDAVATRIVEYGGQRLNESRLDLGYGELMFCADPDGTRIELIQMKTGWAGYASE